MPYYPKPKSNKMKYNSPSGWVYTGKYIPPFEPVKNGFGYVGVILEDCKSGKIQCNICSKWFENFSSHLTPRHNMTSQEYKTKFGLSTSTALKTKKMRLKQSEVMIKLNKENPKCFHRSHAGGFERNNSYSGNRKGKPKSAETINKYGVCDLQIMDKIMKLKEKLGKTPSLVDLKNEYGGTFIFHIYKRYSSYIAFCNEVGFEPITSKDNPKYSREYFIEKGLSTEPSIRILTINEGRALYRYFKHGVKEWKKAVMEQKIQ